MKTSKLFFLLSLVVVTIIAVACSGNGGDADTTENNTVELAQTVTAEDATGGTITVNYPEGWFQSGDPDTGLTFSNVENIDAIESDTPVEAGQMATVVMIVPAELAPMLADAEAEITPMTLLTAFTALMSGEDTPEMGAPEEVTLNGKTGAVATGESPQGSAVMMVLPDGSGAFIVSMGVTATGELDNLRPTFDAISNSVEYTPAAGE